MGNKESQHNVGIDDDDDYGDSASQNSKNGGPKVKMLEAVRSAFYAPGEGVVVKQRDGTWEEARIMEIEDDDTYVVMYNNDQEEAGVRPERFRRSTQEDLRPDEAKPNADPEPGGISRGSIVEVKPEGDGEWERATVTKCHDDGTYTVQYEDGAKDDGMLKSELRLLSEPSKAKAKAQAKHSEDESDADSKPGEISRGCIVEVKPDDGGEWERATVTECDKDGTYTVKYEDGATDACMLKSELRWVSGPSKAKAAANPSSKAKASGEANADSKPGEISPGCIVEVDPGDDGEWERATVTECHKDGTYAVQFVDDGEKDDGISKSELRWVSGPSKAKATANPDNGNKGAAPGPGKISLGCIVEVDPDDPDDSGEWERATVTECHKDGTYTIQYDEGGDKEDGIPKSKLRWVSGPSKAKPGEISPGCIVEVGPDNHGEWERVTVTECHKDGTYTIQYGDGDKDKGITKSELRLLSEPSKAEAPAEPKHGKKESQTEGEISPGCTVEVGPDEDGEWERATVTECDKDGTYTVQYEDGEKAKDIPKSELRWVSGPSKGSHADKEISPGCTIEVDMGGDVWERAIVTECNKDGTYTIQYPDGLTQGDVPASCFRLAHQASKAKASGKSKHAKKDPIADSKTGEISLGCIVEVGADDSGESERATVTECDDDGTFTVRYEDGETQDGIPKSELRWVSGPSKAKAADKPKHKKKDAKGDSKKINEISPGCIVEVEPDDDGGEWEKATITKCDDDGTYRVRYEDGETQDGIRKSELRWVSGPSKAKATDKPKHSKEEAEADSKSENISKGCIVEVNQQDGGEWEKATVTKCYKNGTYKVRYEDGEESKGIVKSDLRLFSEPSKAEAPAQAKHNKDEADGQPKPGEISRGCIVEVGPGDDGEWERATVKKCYKDGTYRVQYENGDSEKGVRLSDVRLVSLPPDADPAATPEPSAKSPKPLQNPPRKSQKPGSPPESPAAKDLSPPPKNARSSRGRPPRTKRGQSETRGRDAPKDDKKSESGYRRKGDQSRGRKHRRSRRDTGSSNAESRDEGEPRGKDKSTHEQTSTQTNGRKSRRRGPDNSRHSTSGNDDAETNKRANTRHDADSDKRNNRHSDTDTNINKTRTRGVHDTNKHKSAGSGSDSGNGHDSGRGKTRPADTDTPGHETDTGSDNDTYADYVKDAANRKNKRKSNNDSRSTRVTRPARGKSRNNLYSSRSTNFIRPNTPVLSAPARRLVRPTNTMASSRPVHFGMQHSPVRRPVQHIARTNMSSNTRGVSGGFPPNNHSPHTHGPARYHGAMQTISISPPPKPSQSHKRHERHSARHRRRSPPMSPIHGHSVLWDNESVATSECSSVWASASTTSTRRPRRRRRPSERRKRFHRRRERHRHRRQRRNNGESALATIEDETIQGLTNDQETKKFAIGQSIKVRDASDDEWRVGTITGLSFRSAATGLTGLPSSPSDLVVEVQPLGWSESFKWSEYQHLTQKDTNALLLQLQHRQQPTPGARHDETKIARQRDKKNRQQRSPTVDENQFLSESKVRDESKSHDEYKHGEESKFADASHKHISSRFTAGRLFSNSKPANHIGPSPGRSYSRAPNRSEVGRMRRPPARELSRPMGPQSGSPPTRSVPFRRQSPVPRRVSNGYSPAGSPMREKSRAVAQQYRKSKQRPRREYTDTSDASNRHGRMDRDHRRRRHRRSRTRRSRTRRHDRHRGDSRRSRTRRHDRHRGDSRRRRRRRGDRHESASTISVDGWNDSDRAMESFISAVLDDTGAEDVTEIEYFSGIDHPMGAYRGGGRARDFSSRKGGKFTPSSSRSRRHHRDETFPFQGTGVTFSDDDDGELSLIDWM